MKKFTKILAVAAALVIGFGFIGCDEEEDLAQKEAENAYNRYVKITYDDGSEIDFSQFIDPTKKIKISAGNLDSSVASLNVSPSVGNLLIPENTSNGTYGIDKLFSVCQQLQDEETILYVSFYFAGGYVGKEFNVKIPKVTGTDENPVKFIELTGESQNAGTTVTISVGANNNMFIEYGHTPANNEDTARNLILQGTFEAGIERGEFDEISSRYFNFTANKINNEAASLPTIKFDYILDTSYGDICSIVCPENKKWYEYPYVEYRTTSTDETIDIKFIPKGEKIVGVLKCSVSYSDIFYCPIKKEGDDWVMTVNGINEYATSNYTTYDGFIKDGTYIITDEGLQKYPDSEPEYEDYRKCLKLTKQNTSESKNLYFEGSQATLDFLDTFSKYLAKNNNGSGE